MARDTSYNLLVCDDDSTMRIILRKYLEEDGYTVFTASRGDEALNVIRAKRMDMILLDRILPDINGLDLIASIRQHTDVPIMVVSSKDSSVDKVVGLEIGADDYLGKPFEKAELLARVKAHVRQFHRKGNSGEGSHKSAIRCRFGNWTLEGGRCQAFNENGNSADLTYTEFRILEALASRPGGVVPREQLLQALRNGGIDVSDRAIDVQIVRIRKKIGDASKKPAFLKTVRGAGYLLECEKVKST